MIRLLVLLTAGLLLKGTAASCKAGEEPLPEAEVVVYWAPQRPVFLRLSLSVEGQSHRAAWNDAAGRLLDAFDDNRDGTVTSQEGLARLLTMVSTELMADADRGPRADFTPLALKKDAFVALLESRGIGPLFIVPAAATASPPNPAGIMARRSVDNDLLMLAFDDDRSGDLSAEELLAQRRRLDLDDDECLSVQELQAARLFSAENPSEIAAEDARRPEANEAAPAGLVSLASAAARGQAAREMMTRYDRDRDGFLKIDDVGLAPQDAVSVDQDGDGRLDLDELRQFLRRPIPAMTLELRWPEANAPRTAILGDQAVAIEPTPSPPTFDREAMLRLFATIDGNRDEYLEPAEAEALPFLQRAFRGMDRDADEKIYAEEFVEYARRVALLAPWRIAVSFQTRSRNAFAGIDRNGDGKLSAVERHAVAREIPGWDADANGAVTLAEISSAARLSIGPAATWTLPASGAASPAEPFNQPVWFLRMDRNQDGVVSPREFLGPRERFLALDANNDGLLQSHEAAPNVPAGVEAP